MHRLKIGTLKIKQLEESKLKEKLKIITKFVKRNIGKYYKIVARQYFIKNHPINIA